MTALWFLYSSVLFIAALVSCSLSLAVWMPTRRRDCLAAAAAFFIYAVEVVFAVLGACGAVSEVLLVDAALSVLLAVAVWTWTLMRSRAPLASATFVVPVVAYAAVALLLAIATQADDGSQRFAYLLVRDLALFGLLIYVWQRSHCARAAGKRLDAPRPRRLIMVACVCAVGIVAEDAFACLVSPSAFATAPGVQPFRWNIAEGIFMVFCAVWVVRGDSAVLSWYFSHPMQNDAAISVGEPGGADMSSGHADEEVPEVDGTAQPIGEDPAAVSVALAPTATIPGALRVSASPEEMQRRILLYSDEHNLSPRERDVLAQVLAGKDIRNIASSLVISPGTVKAHLHRIYRKADVSRREDLIRDFWKL